MSGRTVRVETNEPDNYPWPWIEAGALSVEGVGSDSFLFKIERRDEWAAEYLSVEHARKLGEWLVARCATLPIPAPSEVEATVEPAP